MTRLLLLLLLLHALCARPTLPAALLLVLALRGGGVGVLGRLELGHDLAHSFLLSASSHAAAPVPLLVRLSSAGAHTHGAPNSEWACPVQAVQEQQARRLPGAERPTATNNPVCIAQHAHQ